MYFVLKYGYIFLIMEYLKNIQKKYVKYVIH